jgi:reactive chlorine resistance protein C
MLHAYKRSDFVINSLLPSADQVFLALGRRASTTRIAAIGRGIGLAGVILPLALIGLVKFTQFEVEALRPLITATPWLAWLYAVFGEGGAAALLGVVEIATAALLVLSIWSPRAGIVGGALAALTFATTVSIMLAVPIWEEGAGGFPWINATGQFLLKDVALLGISLAVFGESLARLSADDRARSASFS